MAAASGDPIDNAADLLARAAKEARRIFAGPDGPLALALALALLALAEVTVHNGELETAMISNLLATLPLALVRTRLALAAGLIVFGVVLGVSEGGTLTVAAVLALVTVLYLFAST